MVTPQREVWAGDATLVVARGTEGEVGIQRSHAPLLIRLAVGPLRVRTGSGEGFEAVVDGGFMHVSSDADVTTVDVLADDAVLAEDIDVGEAERLKRDAEARLQEHDDETARADLTRAVARLDLARR